MKLRNSTVCICTFIVFFIAFPYISSADPLDNWRTILSRPSYNFGGVTYAGGRFIAVGVDYENGRGGLILTSSDGVAWTSTISGITNAFNSVAYAKDLYGGLYVAVGDGAILISQDAVNWSIIGSDTTAGLNKVIYEGGHFVAVGGVIVTSSDGVNWSQAPVTDTTFPSGIGVAYGNGIFDTFGFLSSDGVSWSQIAPAINNTRYAGYIIFNDIAFGNGIFVVVGGTQNIGFAPPMPIQVIITSTDGINWTEQENPGIEPLYGITFANNTFIAVGGNGTILTSSNGIDWLPRVSLTIENLNAVTFGNGTFLSVGSGGTILRSDPVSGNCTATLTSDLFLHVPIIDFNGTYLQGDATCQFDSSSSLRCLVASFGEASSSDFSNCEASTLTSDLKLHIPAGIYNNISYQADFEYVPSTDGQIWFKVVDVTKN